MHLVVVGLNYRTAPVEIRERFALAEGDFLQALESLKGTTGILEGVIVATCNRTEIYAVVDRRQVCGHHIRTFLEQWFGIPRQEFNQHLYMYEDDQAVEHLLRVSSGLDSMVLGETQILGQVKDAWQKAQEKGATGTIFNHLFKQAVTFGKRVHTETSIGENAVSVSYAAVELGRRIFGRFDDKTVLIVGAGKMSELTAKHLHANGACRVFVAGRTLSRAEEVAEKFNGIAMTMETAMERLHEADIVISSTGADRFVLTKEAVDRAMIRRKKHPLFLIDIAVPRDVEPACGDIPNVFLYDIDDLEGIVEGNREKRRQEAAVIETMIGEEQETYREWYATLGVSPLIRALQEKSASIQASTMESMLRKLPDLDDREVKVIRKLTKSMVNQMIHDPILRIKELAAEKKSEEALKLFVQLFSLEQDVSKLQAEADSERKTRRESVEQESAPAVRELESLLTRLAGSLQ
jgi:glutamyl-tRNA reductase